MSPALRNAAAEEAVTRTLELSPLLGSWFAFGLAALVLATALAWTAPRGTTRARAATLVALRIVVFAGLCTLSLRPTWRTVHPTLAPARVSVLLDTSASMGLPSGETELRPRLVSAAEALVACPWIEGEAPAPALHRFSSTLESSSVAELRAVVSDGRAAAELLDTGEGSALFAAVHALASARPRPAGILVVSDGRDDRAADPGRAAERIAREGVPVFALPVGPAHARSLELATVEAPTVVHSGDAVTFTAHVAQVGLGGREVRLRLLRDGAEVDARAWFVAGASATVELSDAAPPPGRHEYDLRLETREPSTELGDFERRVVSCVDEPSRVLWIEEFPRWEARLATAALARDRGVRDGLVHRFVGEGPARERSELLPPAGRAELFAFDVIVLGDLSVEVLPDGLVDHLDSFVRTSAGSLLVVPGRVYGTALLEDLASRGLSPFGRGPSGLSLVAADAPFTLASTALGDEVFAGEGADGLPGRPGGRDPSALSAWPSEPRHTRRLAGGVGPLTRVLLEGRAEGAPAAPLLLDRTVGAGRVAVLAIDSTWRERSIEGTFHAGFWGSLVRDLARRSAAARNRPDRLVLEPASARAGETVAVEVELRAGRPPVPTTVAHVMAPGATLASVTLEAVPDRPGRFRGRYLADRAGVHRFVVELDSDRGEDADGALVLDADLEVRAPGSEAEASTVDGDALELLTRATGGALLTADELAGWYGRLDTSPHRGRVTKRTPAWDEALFSLCLASLFVLDWGLRKRWNLR